MKAYRTKEELERDEAQWFVDNPNYTRCTQCKTVIKKTMTQNGLCPDCSKYKGVLG